MGLIQEYTHGSSYLRLNSDGWSGKVITQAPADEEDRSFQFDIDFTLENGQWGTSWVRTDDNSYGMVPRSSSYSNGAIGISLEHMGDGWWDGRYCQQLVGRGDAAPNTRIPAFGVLWTDNEEPPEALNVTDEAMHLQLYQYFSAYYQRAGVQSSLFASINCDPNCNPIMQWIGWVRGDFKAEITTDLPIFATDAELLAWAKDPTNPELIATMLNPPEDIEEAAEEAWEQANRYYYLRNKYEVSDDGQTYTLVRNNFNFKPYGKGRICLYKEPFYEIGASKPSWYAYKIKGLNSYEYDIKQAPWNSFRWDDDDTTVPISFVDGEVNAFGYVKKSAKYADIIFNVLYADTNIPIFGSEELADKYVNEEIDIDQAENYDDIIQEEQKHIIPPWGEEDVDADNGANDQDYSIGARMFAMYGSTVQLSDFFNAIFDPDATDDILSKNGLFGDNQINCIQGLMYLPINVQNFASLGSLESIMLGGWDSEVRATPVTKNNRMWEVGSTYITPVFNDFRDMEPYQQLFISLPYCGLHALNISKYLGKTLSVKYACDLSSGSCSAHIYANGVEYDTFDGNMASQRPITALDQQAYVSSIIKAVSGFADTAMEPISGKVEVAANAMTGNIGGAVGSAVNTAMKDTTLTPRLAYSGAGVAQSIQQKPMAFKGGFFGAIGLFGNQRCHLIVAQRNTVRATNELETIGYPSGYGGFVGSFSGYLQCSAFKMAEGFAGTAEEADEIVSMMGQGVYL